MVEMLLRQIVHRVAVEAARIQIEAHHERVVIGRYLDPAPIEQHPVELQIVPDLQDDRSSSIGFSIGQRTIGGYLSGRSERRSWPPCSSGM
jgi:hypothetical protein